MKEVIQMDKLTAGMEYSVSETVTEKLLAVSVGSGGLEVLATPVVAALMEKAAFLLLEPRLPDGITTVGTAISIEHMSASPLGAEITATARLTEIGERSFSFELEAFDNAGLIAKGTHTRFTVKSERFMEKAKAKLN